MTELASPSFTARLSHGNQSSFILSALMMLPQRSVSEAANCASCSGVDARTLKPMASNLALKGGDSTMRASSLLSLSTTGFGVPDVVYNALQIELCNAG